MSFEIERKFLVVGDFKSASHKHYEIAQGYLSSVAERTVRVRIRDQQGFLTIKGIGNTSGAARFEWEKEIPKDEALSLLELCEKGTISKTRYLVNVGKHTFEVDEFAGENKGLVVAEIELEHEDEPFEKPTWLGEEVTGIAKYYNASLNQNPFRNWK